MSYLSERGILMARIGAELDRAYAKHGRDPWGRHEFYAILKEEVDELWDAIKRDAPDAELLPEIIQVAAMCFRYVETGDRYRGPAPFAEHLYERRTVAGQVPPELERNERLYREEQEHFAKHGGMMNAPTTIPTPSERAP